MSKIINKIKFKISMLVFRHRIRKNARAIGRIIANLKAR